MSLTDEAPVAAPDSAASPVDVPALIGRFTETRHQSLQLAEPLSAEDQVAQSMPDASPTKWHLGHTTWFFETFVVNAANSPVAGTFDETFSYLFNSYYNTVGERQPRAERGLLTRPSNDRVVEYRRSIDQAVADLEAHGPTEEQLTLIELGIHHEQQHQELLLMDALHLLTRHPFPSPYIDAPRQASPEAAESWTRIDGGVYEIGTDSAVDGTSFAFDNEGPRHEVLIIDVEISDRLVTCGDWKQFMADGGYRDPMLWLSDGWANLAAEGRCRPLYWAEGEETKFDLHGVHEIDLNEPVSHISYFEADAFARWAGARLPTEAEWEVRARDLDPNIGHYRQGDIWHPVAPGPDETAMFGTLWEWTASPYTAYPGFAAAPGAVGEYNGKFMNNQYVLRGGSYMTPVGHTRPTYRNFFPPHTGWQASGIRLAR